MPQAIASFLKEEPLKELIPAKQYCFIVWTSSLIRLQIQIVRLVVVLITKSKRANIGTFSFG